MSTKIYNGLRLQDHSLEQALAVLKSVRSDCVRAARIYTASVVVCEMAAMVDLTLNIPGTETPSPWWALNERMVEARRKVLGRGERCVTWDSSFEVCLIPHQGDLLALYYIENDHGYVEALMAAGFENYCYQNATDRPASVTKFEWAARERAWDTALPGITSPAEQGFTFSVVGWDDYCDVLLDRALLVDSLPSEEVRRRAIAIELAQSQVEQEGQQLSLMQQLERVKQIAPARMAEVKLVPDLLAAILN